MYAAASNTSFTGVRRSKGFMGEVGLRHRRGCCRSKGYKGIWMLECRVDGSQFAGD